MRNVDYDKEEQDFLTELNDERFKIERIPNNAADYQEHEDRDLAGFDSYLKSESFKALNTEASKE